MITEILLATGDRLDVELGIDEVIEMLASSKTSGLAVMRGDKNVGGAFAAINPAHVVAVVRKGAVGSRRESTEQLAPERESRIAELEAWELAFKEDLETFASRTNLPIPVGHRILRGVRVVTVKHRRDLKTHNITEEIPIEPHILYPKVFSPHGRLLNFGEWVRWVVNQPTESNPLMELIGVGVSTINALKERYLSMESTALNGG